MKLSDRKIVKGIVVAEPIGEVWKAWTTHEGLKTFFGRDNQVELRAGGKFEIYFLLNNPEGERGSEGCTIRSYLPENMLSFSWNVPPHFEALRRGGYKTCVMVIFNEVDDRRTEIQLTHLGWPDEEEWDRVYEYFDRAWDQVLDRFLKRKE